MKTKVLYNPTTLDIVDYRVEEAEVDQNGNVVYFDSEPKWTGKTFEWSIRSEEKIEFPAYVADYLKKIYNFLEEVKPAEKTEEVKEEVKEAEPVPTGPFICKFCGKSFTSKRNLGLHLGATHYDKI